MSPKFISAPSHMGLSPCNYNYLIYWFALTNHGRDVFKQIFTWGFGGSHSKIKDALFNLPNYNNSRFKSDFDYPQRTKIERGNIEEFDLSLFYMLMQRVCSLPGPHDKLWGKEGDPERLPTILYQIKQKRNTITHDSRAEITEQELQQEISELKHLFNKALNGGGEEFHIPQSEVNLEKEKICKQLESIQVSGSSTIVEHLKKVAEEKVSLAIKEARQDLRIAYKSLAHVLLAPWTVVESFQNVNDVFTEPLLKQDKNNILFQQMNEDDSIIKTEDILVSQFADGTVPTYVLLVSPSGMGKTTLIKYIIQSWLDQNNKIKGLEDIDLLLYMDCRTSKTTSFENFLSGLLPNAVNLFEKSELKILIMTMKVLIILDNIDEIQDDLLPMYEELLKMNSDNIRILATSSQNVSSALNRKCQQKHLKLELEGISKHSISSCISKMYQSLYGQNSDEEVTRFCSDLLLKTATSFNENICSPEILSHVFFHWLMRSKKEFTYTTKTQLFLTTHELLCLKLLEKISSKTQTKIFERKLCCDRLNSFFDKLFKIAFEHFYYDGNELQYSALGELIDICKRLNLPYSTVLMEVICFKEKDTNMALKNFPSISFSSRSLQIFYAAMHITNLFTSNEHLHLEDLGEEFYNITLKRNNFLPLMKFIVGILALTNIKALEDNVEDIFQHILKFCKNPKPSFWLEILEETLCHPTVLQRVRAFMGDSWSLEDFEISAGLLAMLQHYPPKQITLTTCINSREIFFLKDVLKVCSSISNLSLSLHFYYNFWVDKNLICDSYLKLFSFVSKEIKLESFAGKLSAESILKLPASTRRLALHMKPEDITILSTAITKMKDLQLLYLNFDITYNFPAKLVPRMKMPRTDIMLYVDVWKIDLCHVEWACDVVASFSPAYCRLTLRKSSLDYMGARKWLEGLRDRRIHVDTAVIGTTVAISSEKQANLRELATSFECLELRLIHLT